ncbi:MULTISPECIES: MBL fold metallo-hydrolase [unclassified Sphingobium]|uniref:MBL fold metallo-hydrolase n=1 Tax=unclassified Sphingobium TaxID=2611147 RepID=UPI0007F50074|nr:MULTISPECIES: MBL fold metallo-hydrolase [unclassified Sphingobium]OAN59355.1 MBL fold metallo-hydrolase [Sphingobium sp. TCM1]WIW90137.1 MBL fold metallo-hydrolase [Sphingobium sp. V4]
MSMAADTRPQTPLGALVTSGDGQNEAVRIADGILMVKDISNAYLVTTQDGDLLVNTGFLGNGARNKGLFAPHRTGPLRRIILTQSHADHYGALPEQREDGTQVIAGAGFTETADYFDRLAPFLARRSGKLWASMTRRDGPPPKPPVIVPDIEVATGLAFTQGGRRFELVKTPGGETLCSAFLWMPDEGIVFTGNLFGPVWRAMPNLVTIRGDRPRLVRAYLRSVEQVRALDADLVITGHGDPIRGRDAIRADLDRMHAAVSYLERETVAGMNAGRSVQDLMRDIALPDDLRIGEFHGKTAWVVRAIWEENAGWFHYADGTTALYGVPRSAVDADLAEMAGGAGALAARAHAHVVGRRPLEALHLLDIALHVAPDHDMALGVKKTALEQLLAASGGTNLSETMWLKAEIAEVEKRLASQMQEGEG